MSKKTIYLCDIKGCDELRYKEVETAVVFTTEQDEGRSTSPYFETSNLDLCKTHFDRLLESSPLTATGAQGYNDYVFKENK